MKKIIPFFGIFLLLNACASINSSSQITNSINSKAEKCPQPTTVSLSIPGEQENFYDRFDFHIRSIIADADIIKFQTLKHDFVFCRGKNFWTVQPGTLSKEFQPPQNYAEFSKNLVNPAYKSINYQGKTYQYRVVIEPKYFIGKDGNLSRPDVKEPAQEKVVFELIYPNSKKPQRQTLYTLKDLQKAGIGTKVGFPNITAAVTSGNRLWWSVAFEQGEGNNGIATVVGYEPQTSKFTLVQPKELWFHQITDLAITGDANNPTFWMGTKIAGEGNPNIPAKGLVTYRANMQNPNSGTLTSYNVHNSPLVGAIPDKLRLEDKTLWVGTGNGVCQVNWQAADNPQSWSCWRFAALAKLPQAGLPLYNELSNQKPALTLSSGQGNETIEVLWWSPVDFQTRKGRYEVRNDKGFTVTLNEGAKIDEIGKRFLPPGKAPVYWPGVEWHWNGDRFVRGFDEVAQNHFGGGPQGIGTTFEPTKNQRNANAIRGDLQLLKISPNSTSVKYYSGWVDETKLNPYLTVLPQTRSQNPQPNPLKNIGSGE